MEMRNFFEKFNKSREVPSNETNIQTSTDGSKQAKNPQSFEILATSVRNFASFSLRHGEVRAWGEALPGPQRHSGSQISPFSDVASGGGRVRPEISGWRACLPAFVERDEAKIMDPDPAIHVIRSFELPSSLSCHGHNVLRMYRIREGNIFRRV